MGRNRRPRSASSHSQSSHHSQVLAEGHLCLLDLETIATTSRFLPTVAPLSSPLTKHLMPLLLSVQTNSHTWQELRPILNKIFGEKRLEWSEKMVAGLGSGWAGIDALVVAFRRLEEVESEVEATQILAWLEELVIACCRIGYFKHREVAKPIIATKLLSDASSRPLAPLKASQITPQQSSSTKVTSAPVGRPRLSHSFSQPSEDRRMSKVLTVSEQVASYQCGIGPLSNASIQDVIEARSRLLTEADAMVYVGLPPYSWAGMAAQALLWSTSGSCTAKQICEWLRKSYKGLQKEAYNWNHFVMETLPYHPCFIRVDASRVQGTATESGVDYWALDAKYGQLGEESLKLETGNLITSTGRWKAMADLAERIIACSLGATTRPQSFPITAPPYSNGNSNGHHPLSLPPPPPPSPSVLSQPQWQEPRRAPPSPSGQTETLHNKRRRLSEDDLEEDDSANSGRQNRSRSPPTGLS